MEEKIKRMEELLAKAEEEGRPLSEEEKAELAKLEEEVKGVQEVNAKREELNSLKESIALKAEAPEKVSEAPATAEVRSKRPLNSNIEVTKCTSSDLRRKGFLKYVAGHELSSSEARALETGTNSEGGYTVPIEFEKALEKKLQNSNPFRAMGAEVKKTNSLVKIPLLQTRPGATIKAEEAAAGSTEPVFNQISLDAFKIFNYIPFSRELLEDSFLNLEAELVDMIGEAVAYKEEQLILAGAGTTEPLGLLNTTSVGGTSVVNVDITSVDATTNDVKESDITTAFHTLKFPYHKASSSLVWVMSHATYLNIALLKDTNGRPLLGHADNGMSVGDQFMLKGRPVIISDHMPDVTEDSPHILLIDLKHLTIGDRSPLSIKKDEFSDINTDGIRLYYRKRFDCVLRNAEAMITLTKNTS